MLPIDIKTSVLNGQIDEVIWICQPDGYIGEKRANRLRAAGYLHILNHLPKMTYTVQLNVLGKKIFRDDVVMKLWLRQTKSAKDILEKLAFWTAIQSGRLKSQDSCWPRALARQVESSANLSKPSSIETRFDVSCNLWWALVPTFQLRFKYSANLPPNCVQHTG